MVAAMDKRSIARYLFVIDWVCVGYDHDRLVRRVLGSDWRAIPVTGVTAGSFIR